MDEAILEAAFVAAAVLVPIAAFAWAARRPNPTSRHLVFAATCAGLLVGVVFFAVAVAYLPERALGTAYYPWIMVFAAVGLGVGVCGVVARWVGGSLAARR